MNGPFDKLYSTQELQQLFSAQQKPNWSTRSNSISSIHNNNHESSSSIETNNPLNTSSNELVGESLHNIIMPNDKEMIRRRNLSTQLTPVDAENRYSMMTEMNGSNNGISECQISAANEQIYQEQRSSSGAYDIEKYEEIKRPMSVRDPQNDVQHSIQNQNVTINSSEPAQNSAEKMLDDMMFTPVVTSEMFIEDDSYGLGLSSPQYSLNIENKSLDQINDNYMTTSPQQEAFLLYCDSMQYGDSSSFNTNLPMAAFDKEITASPTGNSNMDQYQTKISSVRSTDVTNTFPTQNYTFPIGPTPNFKSYYSSGKQSDGNYHNVYCQSGFDLLGALMKVTSRKNPEINIGKVDMSCAFTVCDISLYDCPIIYVSDVFENLTGYNQYEVKGQNCRFLQSPNGKVEAGTKREFVDNDSIRYLKEKVDQVREAQRSVINYRKGGQPFMNILTIIPITGEDNVNIRYFVGFQVDLVETPTSVRGKTASGTLNVNYSHCTIPSYVWSSPKIAARQALDSGQSISREDVSTVLASLGAGTESELMKRVWDKIVLENMDDVVHVLSLKGLFLYLSPSSRQVLEYDASELVGRALSAVCHPSDIVSVTRELKDTSTGIPVNVVFRIRRKNSGYTWFESHGSLCVEQGKGRKCIILVGRERPVYALDRSEIELAGGIGESEMWNKISTSGIFLFVSSSVRNLLDRSPSDLVGTSFQALIRAESKIGFSHSLEKARSGKIITYAHEILGKRGLMMQAQTTLFPGDASRGEKPTFLVAQTKLIRSPKSAQSTTISTQIVKALSVSDGQEPQSRNSIGIVTQAGSSALAVGSQHIALASESNVFVELKTTRCTAWQFELRQMEKSNRLLAEELATLLSNKKKRKRRKGAGFLQRDCANCHTRVTPEWRRGPSGDRDLCNSCGLRYAKQNGRVSPRNSSRDKMSINLWSSIQSSPLRQVYCQSPMNNNSQNTQSNKSFISTESSDRSIKNTQTDSSSEITRITDITPSIAQGIGMNFGHVKKENYRESTGK